MKNKYGLGNFEKEAVRVKNPTEPRFASDKCSDHWTNIIIFGECWKHQKDGRFKPLFGNKQSKEF